MTSAIDPSMPIEGAATTASVRANFLAAKSEIEALQAEQPNFAKAWLYSASDGVATGSYNVQSITKNALNDYTINFINALSSTHYVVAGSAGLNTTSQRVLVVPNGFRATTSVRVQIVQSDGVLGVAFGEFSLAIFGG